MRGRSRHVWSAYRGKFQVSDGSAIEWTDATWNPVTGCTKVSPGCRNCYAERFSERFRDVPGHPYQQGFDLRLWPERLHIPLSWRKPRRVFVNSMSDLFHEAVPDRFIEHAFETMAQVPHHTFQLLTKRAQRFVEWSQHRYTRLGKGRKGKKAWPQNVWAGVSVESQDFLWRVRALRRVPSIIRFVSFEPLIAAVRLDPALLRGIDWVIVGGESGPGARRMLDSWVRDIRGICETHRISFFFKQWGAYDESGNRLGKKRAGRVLDGRTWDEFPRF